MGWEEIRWRKECGMGERQTKHTKTENKKKREQNTPSKAEQLQCAFRFAAIPGLQAAASAADPSRIRCSDVMMI